MSLGSVEGLLFALLFVVPGSTGLLVRGYVWPTRRSTGSEELVRAVAHSTGALLLLEVVTGVGGLLPSTEWRLGTFLINDLLGGDLPAQVDHDISLWYRLLLFAVTAVALPSVMQWVRSRPALLRLVRADHISLYNGGFDAMFRETIIEAARWDPRWRLTPGESPWVLVDTDDGRRYRGQVMWRSTAPSAPELILIDVGEITYGDAVVDLPAMLLIGGESIRRLWVMRPSETGGPGPALHPLARPSDA
ncbi:MAG TPA: DUF6338 family protein [Actinomycetota bacterium]|nr:DUF6338 family protein [Actinomycetota bacterium]